MKLVDVDAIRKANFCVAIDAVNSVGGTIVPALLKALGVGKIVEINCEPTGNFAHQPEPLPENLVDTAALVLKNGVDVCFVVDPDVDRLAIISEDATMFNEEYTLVAVADYILAHTPGNTVSNLSSSRALLDVSEKYGVKYTPSAVGEVNVTKAMKETKCGDRRRRQRRHHLSRKPLWPRCAGWHRPLPDPSRQKRSEML